MIILATANRGKQVEISALLSSLGIPIYSLCDFSPPIELVEEGDTFEENATQKALLVAQTYNAPALADDSGLCVDALNGRPGVFSARFGSPSWTDAQRNQHLLQELASVESHQRTADFRCVIAFALPNRTVHLFHGLLHGMIAITPDGTSGFGYDPLFVPRGFQQTLAKLGPDIKRHISHRAIALSLFCEWLQQNQNYLTEPFHTENNHHERNS